MPTPNVHSWSDLAAPHLHVPRLPLVPASRNTALLALKHARHVPMSDFSTLPVPSLWTTVPLGQSCVSITCLFLQVPSPPLYVNDNSFPLPHDAPAPTQFYFAFLALTTTWQCIICLAGGLLSVVPHQNVHSLRQGLCPFPSLSHSQRIEQSLADGRCSGNGYWVNKWMTVLFWRAVWEYVSKHEMTRNFDLANSAS